MENLAQLEKTKGTLRILTHINESGDTRISEITNETGLTTYMTYSALGHLIGLELIREELSGGFPSKKCYKLTGKGKEIAEQIGTIRGILAEMGKKTGI